MPKARRPAGLDRKTEDMLRARAAFGAAFRRSRRGNLWLRYDDRALTVFRREGGGYSWCISREDDETEYPRRGFDTEEDAIADLWSVVEGYRYYD
jgi:hypothetical protein